MTDSVITFLDVAKTYLGPPRVTALLPCNLMVTRGEYVAITGPSGSGKSTLLNIVGLLDRPTNGRYMLDGLDTASMPERERAALRGHRVGFVFQSFHLLQYRTAEENVMLAQLYNSTRPRTRLTAARDALQRVGLTHRLGALPVTMSGGEQQRAAIARAIVNQPSLLLCDELTGNLDSETARAVLDVLDELHAGGLTIVTVTHDPNVAARAERLVTMRDGVATEHSRSRTPT